MINPLVSVIVPCYNHEKYIKECLSSVLHQSYPHVELIVIDDGSNDNSVTIIEELLQTENFFFEKQSNSGVSKTLNNAIKKYAKGKYIAFLASDDFWHPDKLKIQVFYLEANTEYAMVCSNAFIVNENSAVYTEFGDGLFKGTYTFNEIALGKCLVPALTVILKKEVFNEVGYFDEDLMIEDLDMWLRVANKYRIGVINQKLAYYRQHQTNVSSNSIGMAKARFIILDKWKNRIPSNIFNKIGRNWELLALKELGKSNPEMAKLYFKPTFKKFFNSSYRKFIIKFFITGKF